MRCVPFRRRRGVALVCALTLMLVAAVLALAVGRLATTSLAQAQWERDHAVARTAADAALRDAERDLAGRPAPRPPAEGPQQPGPQQPGPQQPGPLQEGPLAYGQRTGARMAVGGPLSPARLPVYVIEWLPAAAPGQGALARITAIGTGTRAATQVTVQALYRTQPPGRIDWRELAQGPAGSDDGEGRP